MSRRIEALDAVRGASLIGIAFGNVMWFSAYAVVGPDAHAASATARLDVALVLALHVLVDGKFYGLFSLLFGVGFALLVRTAGPTVVVGRLTRMGLIGALHASLLWFGDIVSLYAVAAIPLWSVRRWSTRALRRLAVACLLAPVAVTAVRLAVGSTDTADPGHGPAALLPAFADGSYVDVVRANAAFLAERWVRALASSRFIRIFGLFVLGLVVARRVLARRGPRPVPAPPGWLWLTAIGSNLALAALAHAPVRPPTLATVVHDAVAAVAIPSGCLLYAMLLWRFGRRGGAVVRALAAAGRLSLTLYITQSLIFAIVFYGYGLGLWGTMGAAGAMLVAAVVVTAQVFAARVVGPGRGPLERLLRGR